MGSRNQEYDAARQVYSRIPLHSWINLHPQLVCERDAVLRACGEGTITQREYFLSLVDASQDDWVRECRARLLADKGCFAEAKELLLSAPFQKVHQTYSRTELWKQICEGLGENSNPIPSSLGEDNLARFGAYREYDE